jgi:hypothetical protein
MQDFKKHRGTGTDSKYSSHWGLLRKFEPANSFKKERERERE